MNKITVCKGNEKYNIYINNYKFFVGNNEKIKFDIKRTLKRFSLSYKASEYGEEHDNIPKIYINDILVKIKECNIFFVSKEYSMVEDFKLTSHSLILKYLEVLLESDVLIDTINTINILFESLTTEILSLSQIAGHFNSMTAKQLIKLITPFYIVDEEYRDDYDMSLEEIIIFQLKLIKYIVDNKVMNQVIVCVDIPIMTDKILQMIRSIDNAYLLIMIDNFYEEDNELSNYSICEKIYLDLADDNRIYEVICDNNYCYLNLMEGKEYMKEYIKNKGAHIDFINKLLK